LVDTNILLRISRRSDPQQPLVDAALHRLANAGTTRLVAVMRVHGVEHILTLNVADFSRYEMIEAVHPSGAIAG
jgi:hypothetical protein